MHLGRLVAEGGFTKTVAIKRLHPHVAKDPDLAALFLDEARLVARIDHPNIAKTLDVARSDAELFIVMEYLVGAPLSALMREHRARDQRVPVDVAVAIVLDALRGLEAAHETTDVQGIPLRVVHRDVSPANLLVGTDGMTRVLDFGIAKSSGRAATTKDGQVKGKLSYMAPEQLTGREVDRRVDVFATGIVLWELLTGERLFGGGDEGATLTSLLHGAPVPPSEVTPGLPAALDAIVVRAMQRNRDARFATARDMAAALEAAAPAAHARRVASWLRGANSEALATRAAALARLESAVPDELTHGSRPPSPSITGTATVESDPEPARSRSGLRRAFLVLAFVAALGLALALAWATGAPAGPAQPGEPATKSSTTMLSASPRPKTRASDNPSAPAHRRDPRPPTSPASPSAPPSSATCPVRSYLDARGILRFTRQCP